MPGKSYKTTMSLPSCRAVVTGSHKDAAWQGLGQELKSLSTIEEVGHLRLNNRGSIRTTQEFPGPIEIEFDWRWIDLAGDSLYRDTLTVVLHSSGEHAKQHPFAVVDGL